MKRTALVIATIGLVATAGLADAAPGKGKGHGSGQVYATYAKNVSEPRCAPGADACTATGSAAADGPLSAAVEIRRTVGTTGADSSSDLPYLGQSFTLDRPAKQVRATFSFSDIAVLGSQASSSDGQAFTGTWIGAEISDTACATRGCGASEARVDVHLNQVGSIGGQPTGTGSAVAPSQTLVVTLSMPDGSDLPRGTVFANAWVNAQAHLVPLSCVSFDDPAQTCSQGPSHTGTASSSVRATVALPVFTVS